MKKITIVLIFVFVSLVGFSQTVMETAEWPSSDPTKAWTITGTYNTDPDVLDAAFEANPTLTSNFAWDDDDAGNTSSDQIAAESPVIDLTAAIANGETRLEVTTSYHYNDLFDTLLLEWYDADNDDWVEWHQFEKTREQLEDLYCSGKKDFFSSNLLNIAGLSITQQQGFKYRISYDDEGGANPGWRWGFCFDAPTIRSAGPPRKWYLKDVVFSNGVLAKGSFEYDAITQTYFNININIFNSPENGDVSYGRRHPTSEGNDSFIYALETLAAGDLTDIKGLSLVWENPLPAAGGTINIDPTLTQTFSAQGVCVDAICSQRVSPIDTFVGTGSSGYVTTTPESQPTTWYLNNVRFTNGAYAYGSFVFDPFPAPGDRHYSDYNITVFNAPDNGDTSYGEVPSFSPGNKNFMFTLETVTGDLTDVKGLSFVFEGEGLTTAEGTVPILQVQSSAQAVCQDASCSTRGTFFDNVASNSSVTTLPPPAITYYLDNVVLDNGTTATGSFDYNVVTNTYSNINIIVHNSPTNGNTSYGFSSTPFDSGTLTALSEDPAGDLTNAGRLSFLFTEPFGVSGGVRDLENSSSVQGICEDASCSTFPATDIVQSGGVTSVGTAPTITTDQDVSVEEGQTFVVDLETIDINGDSEGAGLTYSLEDDDDYALFNLDTTTGEVTFITAPDFRNPLDQNTDNIYWLTVNVTETSGLKDTFYLYITVTDATDIFLNAKVLLQGAALNPNTGEESLMRDDLRVAGWIPEISPYADDKSIVTGVLDTGGTSGTGLPADDIVDWVYVELREEGDNTTAVVGQSGLLQRDGDIVDVDGVSPLRFDIAPGNYHVVVKHRNHLGFMSLDAVIEYTDDPVVAGLDFTDGNILTYGTNALVDLSTDGTGLWAMWAGNVSGDNTLKYQGGSNDTTAIKDEVLNDSGNSSSSNLHTFLDYSNGDVDMDGTVQYQGSGNDSNVIKDVILSHTDNQSSPSNLFIITEQLPELIVELQINTIFNLNLINQKLKQQ